MAFGYSQCRKTKIEVRSATRRLDKSRDYTGRGSDRVAPALQAGRSILPAEWIAIGIGTA
jgi:hypothetical protein